MKPCDEVLRQLDDFVDGRLGPEASDAVAAHLTGCPACQAVVERTRRVLDAAAALPAEVAPARDLWPGIAARLHGEVASLADHRRGRRWPLAAAAALVIAAAGIALLRWPAPPAPGRPGAVGVSAASLASDTELAAALAEYQRAAMALRTALARRAEGMPPATRRVIESNLAVVDAAVSRLTSALAADPGNRDLALLLTAAHERQLDLLLTANQLTRT